MSVEYITDVILYVYHEKYMAFKLFSGSWRNSSQEFGNTLDKYLNEC